MTGAFAGTFKPGFVPTLVAMREGPVAFVNFTAGEGGGQALFVKRGARWCRLVSGGG